MDLPAWTQRLSQHNRLIEIDTALPQAFVVERFRAREAVSESFVFEIDCLSANAFLNLRTLLGQEMTLRLRRPDGGHRVWHGYVTQASNLGSEGGAARYRLKLESWLAFLRLRRNRLIYQDLDERGILERLFAHYPQANYRIDVTQPLAARPIRTQYESDFDYLIRLLAEAGLAYRFEHDQDDAPAQENGQRDHARHALVIFDPQAEVPEAEPAQLRFHRVDGTEQDDAVVLFAEQQQLTPDLASVASWQPEQLRAPAAQAQASDVPVPGLEVYHAARSGIFPAESTAQATADIRLNALRLPARLHAGAGSGRGLAVGFGFTLAQHPDLSGQRFIPLAIEHTASNNLGSEAVALLDASDLEQGTYRNRFVCVPADTPIVPTFVAKPTAPGPQTARVVGLPDSAITSHRDHQVRIQLWWQRGQAPNPDGLRDTGSSADPKGHAPGDASSGTWVPVAEWVSGPNFGSNFLPRIGGDVLVDFAHGDLDQPIIVGQLYNGTDLPPYAAGIDSDANHIGVLSGLQTQELDGDGRNRWILDDAPGQLRHQLDSSLADSKLALGRLIDQSGATRGALRGEGIELGTQGWAIQRAGEGFLVSTTAKAGATSTQLDVSEAVGQLQAAVDAATRLSDAAAQAEAVPLDANERQQAFLQTIDPVQDGKYTGAINGQPAHKPQPGSREAGDPVERFAAPVIVQETPTSLVHTSPGSVLAYAGQAQHWTVQQDAHFAAGATFAAVAGAMAGLLAHDGPLQAIAAHGPVSVQANTDRLELLADQDVTITSNQDTIEVLASKQIVLQAGQSQVTLQDGNIVFKCPGRFTVKAATHPFLGGEKVPVNFDALPSAPAATELAFVLKDDAGEVLPQLDHIFDIRGGDLRSRTESDDEARTQRHFAAAPEPVQAHLSYPKIEMEDDTLT